MAVQFDNGPYLAGGSTLALRGHSVAGFFRQDVGADSFDAVFSLLADGNGSLWIYLNGFELTLARGGTGGRLDSTILYTQGVWYAWGYSVEADGTGVFLFQPTDRSAPVEIRGISGVEDSTAFLVNIARVPDFGGVLTGSVRSIRFWDVPLNQTELLSEMSSLTAVRTSNLYAEYQLVNGGTAADDTSGNGRNLFVDGGPLPTSTDPIFPVEYVYTQDVNTVVQETLDLDANANAILAATVDLTVQANGLIAATYDTVYDVNTVIENTFDLLITANTVIQLSDLRTSDTNAVVQDERTLNADVSTVIQDTLVIETQINGVIFSEITIDFAANAIITANVNGTAVVNAVILSDAVLDATANAIINSDITQLAFANASIALIELIQVTANSVITLPTNTPVLVSVVYDAPPAAPRIVVKLEENP